MIVEVPSPNYNPRPAGKSVDILLIHYTGMTTADEALERLCNITTKVSSHYLIDEEGVVYSLVNEYDRAWHAGVACWGGDADVNDRSIGIELANPGHDIGYRGFAEAQMKSLLDLSHEICNRHVIPACQVLGHADVAPARKKDPGELFDWAVLAKEGIGLWPIKPATINLPECEDGLAAFGYDIVGAGLRACTIAFQRHWRPQLINGVMDNQCLGLLACLLAYKINQDS